MFVLYSNQRCAWVYKYTFDEIGDLTLNHSDSKPQLVKQRDTVSIKCLNENQVVIQSINCITIFNILNGQIDYKVAFLYNMNIDVTVSETFVCVPRIENGVLLKFGAYTKYVPEEASQVLEGSFTDLSRWATKAFRTMTTSPNKR